MTIGICIENLVPMCFRATAVILLVLLYVWQSDRDIMRKYSELQEDNDDPVDEQAISCVVSKVEVADVASNAFFRARILNCWCSGPLAILSPIVECGGLPALMYCSLVWSVYPLLIVAFDSRFDSCFIQASANVAGL